MKNVSERVKFRRLTLALVGTCLAGAGLLGAAAPPSEDDVVMKAMRDELVRSVQKLQLESQSKPYFISYLVRETRTRQASATFGSLVNSDEHHARTLAVIVRVGDYSLDNTNILSMRYATGRMGFAGMAGGGWELPLEDNYKEIRRQIWLATDAAYKNALEDLAAKRAALQVQTRGEDIPDFTREQPLTMTDRMPPATVNRAEAEAWVRDLSALSRDTPDVFSSAVRLEVIDNDIRYVNSEGTTYTRLEPGVMFVATARTQAADGMPLEDFVSAYGRSMQDLSKDALAARIREMGVRLKQLREAPLLDHYSGPVLIEGQAAAELLSRVFAPKLLAIRRPLSDNPQLAMLLGHQAETLLDRIGGRVLPDFLAVVDNPTIEEFNHTPLVGGYKVDLEGVRARETVLVEKGILKTLLASRDPVPGITHSTGNNQGGPGPLPTNLIVTAEKGLSSDEMKAELLRLVKQRGKEYGIVVSRVPNPLTLPSVSQLMAMFMPQGMGGERGEVVLLASKVYADGRQEVIRNAELSGLSVAAFKDVVAASKEQTVYSTPFVPASAITGMFSGGGALPGGAILSFVVPSLLFDDLSLKKSPGEIPNPPVAKHPFFNK